MIREISERESWDKLVCENGGHPLQLFAWGELKSREKTWVAKRVAIYDEEECFLGGAQILRRRLPFPFREMWYVPRGPFFAKVKNREKVLKEVADFAKKSEAMELKIEPNILRAKDLFNQKNENVARGKFTKSRENDFADAKLGSLLGAQDDNLNVAKEEDLTEENGERKVARNDDTDDFIEILRKSGFRESSSHVFIAKTIWLDLTKNEDDILVEMSKKTRQYIRKSEKDGVAVREISNENDLRKVLKIYAETAARDGFAKHCDEYYLNLAKIGGSANQIWLAEKDGQELAFLWNFATPEICFELYGGNNREGQNLRANYILKWRAISFAKKQGSRIYDLNGLLNDGVSNFKLGFSDGRETNLVGTWDFPLSRKYFAWEKMLPGAKKVVQRMNKIRDLARNSRKGK